MDSCYFCVTNDLLTLGSSCFGLCLTFLCGRFSRLVFGLVDLACLDGCLLIGRIHGDGESRYLFKSRVSDDVLGFSIGSSPLRNGVVFGIELERAARVRSVADKSPCPLSEITFRDIRLKMEAVFSGVDAERVWRSRDCVSAFMEQIEFDVLSGEELGIEAGRVDDLYLAPVGSFIQDGFLIGDDSQTLNGLGLVAFCVATAGGLIMAKIMNLFLKKKINPLIGSAGVSAVPMAARVSNKVGLEYDPSNFILMHAMGPNVSGVIGTAIAAGVFIATYGM